MSNKLKNDSYLSQSQSHNSIFDETIATFSTWNGGSSSQQPIRQRSWDITDPRGMVNAIKQQINNNKPFEATQNFLTVTSTIQNNGKNNACMRKFSFASHQQKPCSSAMATTTAHDKSPNTPANYTDPTDSNVLLDPDIIDDYPTQALLLTVLATLVRNSIDENEMRILYEYIAEASVVFAKVFPVIHSLLDSKINNILQLSSNESILNSIQSIIQNMISHCELDTTTQQQLSYLQSCGFGGLWRFSQPFLLTKEKPENVELFIDCLEAMVETCLPADYETNDNVSTMLNNSSSLTSTSIQNKNGCFFMNAAGSLSNLSIGSMRNDKDSFELNDLNNLNKDSHNEDKRISSTKNIM
jgi:neurofibromin 1